MEKTKVGHILVNQHQRLKEDLKDYFNALCEEMDSKHGRYYYLPNIEPMYGPHLVLHYVHCEEEMIYFWNKQQGGEFGEATSLLPVDDILYVVRKMEDELY